ncbi:hypothetical protein P0136_12020 [Lentisphaerota bacterium ZTH]|nr:hypothetical protein JYG24_10470 [Lentisphaerota bacterium]WET06084.1 hypothetical protein P0136_12020 [Lentisphaerota bacterium ZTH]
MRKSLCISIIYVIIFAGSFISKAATCAICSQEYDKPEHCSADFVEYEFRKLYEKQIKEYIQSEHVELIADTLDLNTLCELYNIPARQMFYSYSNTYGLLKNAEEKLQAKRLKQSVGDILPYDKIRKDIKDTLSDLQINENRTGFECTCLPEIDERKICSSCSLCKLSLDYDKEVNPDAVKMPVNIQLALKLEEIVKNSDVVVLLGRQHYADLLLLSYLKLFSNKRFVLGLDAYDPQLDWTDPELNKQVFQAVHDTINMQYNDFSPYLSRLITNLGYPILNYEKYFYSKNYFDGRFFRNAHYASVRENLVSFLDARCPNAVCFGVSTALTQLKCLRSYDTAIEVNYDLLKDAYEDLGKPVPTLKEALHEERTTILTGMTWAEFPKSKTVRQRMVDKIGSYFRAVNRPGEPKVPFIILLEDIYGLWMDESDRVPEKYTAGQKQLLIQNLIKEKLINLGFKDADKKVTTVLVPQLVIGARGAIFSKEKNDFLNDLCLDYVVSVNRSSDL